MAVPCQVLPILRCEVEGGQSGAGSSLLLVHCPAPAQPAADVEQEAFTQKNPLELLRRQTFCEERCEHRLFKKRGLLFLL